MATLHDEHRDTFSIWAPFEPLEKAGVVPEGGAEPKLGPIEGVVSSEREDEDDEVVVQSGIDWSYFKAHGKLTYGHPASPHNVCGEPVDIVPVEVDGIPAHRMTGHLFLADPLGKAVWHKALMLKKSGARTRLGFSVEGYAIERDPIDRRRITKSKVVSVAIDTSPKNHDSWLDVIAASMGAQVARAGFPTLQAWAEAGCPLRTADTPVAKSAPVSTRDRLLKGVSTRDLLVLRVLKRFPHLSALEGAALLDDYQRRSDT